MVDYYNLGSVSVSIIFVSMRLRMWQDFKLVPEPFLGLAVAASFLAAEQGAVRCENHNELHEGFRASKL